MDKVLTALKDSKKPEDQIAFSNSIDNDMNIYNYIHEVASIEDDKVAQKRIEETLLPNPAMAKQLQSLEVKPKK